MAKTKAQEYFGIIGLGRFGSALAKSLTDAGKEVIVIDGSEAKIKEARAYTENAFVVENLTKETLQDAGIKNCDTVIICIAEKIDASILTTLNVVSLGVRRVIAKATSYEHGLVLEKIGAQVVYPEHDMAVRLANKLVSNSIMDFISLSKEIDISELKLTSVLNGVTIRDADIRKRFGLNVIALQHEGTTSIDISPDLVLSENDVAVVIGKSQNVQSFEEYLQK